MISTLFLVSTAFAGPAKIMHQTSDSAIVRMGASDSHLVWQEVGNQGSERYVYTLDTRSGRKSAVDAGRRPFGPQVSGGMLIYGAGRINSGVIVSMYDFVTNRTFNLQANMGWISEPAIQVLKQADGKDLVRAVWDWSFDIYGEGMEIVLFEGGRDGKGSKRILVKGPIELRDSIPPEYHGSVLSEYPELSGDIMVFQNNEYGTPSIYRMDIKTGTIKRLAPSIFYQERPHVDGKHTVWEESEKGFAISNISSIFLHNAETNEVKMINQDPGFHFQVRIKGNYVLYGSKREPMPNTPSLIVYDIALGIEYNANKCFPGSLFDYAAIDTGLYAAQRMQNGNSRLLFATWDQLKAGCQ